MGLFLKIGTKLIAIGEDIANYGIYYELRFNTAKSLVPVPL